MRKGLTRYIKLEFPCCAYQARVLIAGLLLLCYHAGVTASDTGNRKEVSYMEFVLSFLVAVAAGVVCHYVIKWLDSDK